MEINNALEKTSFLLPSRLASSGIAVNKTEYIAVDGLTPCAYAYSFCGIYKSAIPTLRPYGKIVYNLEKDIYYALGTSCPSTIYVLNSCFEETDSFSLCYKPLVDISFSENTLYCTTPSEAFGYSSSKTNIKAVSATACSNIYLQSYARYENIQGKVFFQNNKPFIIVNSGENSFYTQIPNCISVKTLFVTDGGGIYGLFGKNYINNYILPLYENASINFNYLFEFLFN